MKIFSSEALSHISVLNQNSPKAYSRIIALFFKKPREERPSGFNDSQHSFNGKSILKSKLAASLLTLMLTNDATSQTTGTYSTRKVNPAYTGNAMQIRRSLDNAVTDIGFNSCGDLDTMAILRFLAPVSDVVDNVATTPAVIFSLRRMRSSYTGFALKVRSSAAGNPTQDIGFLPSGVLDTTSLKSFVGSNSGFIETWYDQSGNGRHITQTTLSRQPRIINAGVLERGNNGIPAVFFDGGDDELTRAWVLSSTPFSNSVVVMPTGFGSSGPGKELMGWGNNSTSRFGFWFDRASSVQARVGSEIMGRGQVSSANYAANNRYIITQIQPNNNLTSLTQWIGGSSVPLSNIGGTGTFSPSTGEFKLGGIPTFTGGGYNFLGQVQEAMVFAGALSEANRQLLESSQSLYYNNSTVPPSSSTPLSSICSPNELAYSMRKINGAYSGPAINVRNSSTGTTQDIGFLSSGALDTAALKTFVGSNSGFVTTWYDQSGNGRNLTQSTTTAQPRIVNAGVVDRLNGIPSMVFDGADDRLWHNSFPTSRFNGNNQGFSMNVVAAYTTRAGSGIGDIQSIIDNNHGGSNAFTIQEGRFFGASTPLYVGISTSGSGGFARSIDSLGDGQWRNISLYFDHTYGEVYRNGRLKGSVVLSASNANYFNTRTPFSVGAWHTSGGPQRYLSGRIAEVVIFSDKLSNDERNLLESGQVSYYGINNGVAAVKPDPTGYVVTWYDQSGSGNHLTSVGCHHQPRIYSGGKITRISGIPALLFQQRSQTAMQRVLSTAYTGNTATVNFIAQIDSNNFNQRIFSTGNSTFTTQDLNNTSQFAISTNQSPLQWRLIRNSTVASQTATTGSCNIGSGQLYSPTTRGILGVNGTYNTNTSFSNANLNFGAYRIGGAIMNGTVSGVSNGDWAYYFNGRIAEVVVNPAGQNETRTHLLSAQQSEKTGTAIANDVYVPITGSNYKQNVVGIGRTSATDSVRRISSRSGLIIEDSTSSANNFLRDNGDYMVMGELCSDIPNITTQDLTQGVHSRWTRIWEVKKTDVGNNGGAVNFTFDFEDYWGTTNGVKIGPNVSKYVLLKRSGTSGNFDTLAVSSKTLSGYRVTFKVDAVNVNTFFTLGTLDPGLTPLPVSWLSFSCNRNSSGQAEIRWSTASEENTAYFEVERSLNGKDQYVSIRRISAAGHSQTASHYSYTDPNPPAGACFYRIRQVDLNGSATLSSICYSNQQATAGTDFEIFPNPASTDIKIRLSSQENDLYYTVYNMKGALQLSGIIKTESLEQMGGTFILGTSSLLPGSYMIRITGIQQDFKRSALFIKE
jgi:hypothetical protein